jgi:hypothetical protein
METRAVRRRIEIPDMAAGRRFGAYKRQKERCIRENTVNESEGLKRLVELCRTIEIRTRRGRNHQEYDRRRFYRTYDQILRSASQIEYSAEDVFAFSLMLNRFDDKEGPKLELSAFLSAIINAGREMGYSLSMYHTDGHFPFLGHRNTKDISIEGDIDCIGTEMRGGTVVVDGSAEHVGGHMEGGCITINGDCHSLGSNMRGGKIVVKGNVREGLRHRGSYCGIGFDTSGGSIEVRGDCQNVANVSQGNVTVGGDVKKAGMRNNGATIRIGGSVTEELAKWMWDGEIHVGGEIPRHVREFYGGKIFHKGRLVIDMPKSYGSSPKHDIEVSTGTLEPLK